MKIGAWKPIAGEIAAVLVGCLISAWLVQGFFVHPRGEIHGSHEGHSYVYRLVEFRDLLAAGYVSPQWCSNFRGGLGSPFFGYYQPGFFYIASLVPWSIDPVKALGFALGGFALLGFWSTYRSIRRLFDPLSGVLAGGLLLLSVYAGTELYVRGDLSEFAAMMLLPPLFASVVGWAERRATSQLVTIAVTTAALIATHPCIALPGFAVAVCLTLGYAIYQRDWRSGAAAIAALGWGIGMAGFYWAPIVKEWSLVQASGAFEGYYHYSHHFAPALWLLGPYTRQTSIPFTLGLLLPVLALANVVGLGMRWSKLTTAQRCWTVANVAILLTSIFFMTSLSRPIWAAFSPLQKLQFPWRLMAIVTVSLAALCGPVLLMLTQRWRFAVVVLILSTQWILSLPSTARFPASRFKPISTGAELAETNFTPDLKNEWLPRDATAEFTQSRPRIPLASAGIEVADFQRGAGRLSATVIAPHEGTVRLPHYAFAGWHAEIAGRPVEIQSSPEGLMVVHVSPASSGPLRLTFTATPARRWGWLLSLLSLGSGVVCLLVFSRVLNKPSSVVQRDAADASAKASEPA